MSDTPMKPLAPADCDLRDFAFLQLDVRRLLTSETWILGTGDERAAAMTLWLESWHQVPAASVPNNDRMLAHLSQAGANWPQVKQHALRGWVDGGDGRLYHPVVAEKALAAWIEKLHTSISGLLGNARRWGIKVDTREQQAKLVEAIERLREIAPQHPALKKKLAVQIATRHLADRGATEQPSPPDSGSDRKREGEGDRERDNPPYPPAGVVGVAPGGAEGGVFPSLEGYVDLDDLVEADESCADLADLDAADAVPAVAAVNDSSTDDTPEEVVCSAMTAVGIPDARPGDARLRALLRAGADLDEFVNAAYRALEQGKGFPYAVGIVAGERRRAAELAGQLHAGALPTQAKAARPTFAQAQSDLVRSTVPGRAGKDPALKRIEADAARAAPMPPHIRAQIDAMRGRVAA